MDLNTYLLTMLVSFSWVFTQKSIKWQVGTSNTNFCQIKSSLQYWKKCRYTIICSFSSYMNIQTSCRTEVLIFKGNYVPEMPLHILNGTDYESLDIVDMSNNHINIIKGRTFHKVWNVRTLILDHNNLEITDEEHPRMFSNFENLERLHLTNAFTEEVNATDTLLSLEDIFYESDLRLVKILHLEQNEIWEIGNNKRVFCQLPALTQLMLGDNRITDMDFVIDCLQELYYIDLERNNIARLSQTAMERLDNFHGAPTRKERPLQIKLLGNPFVCDCRSTDFYHWLLKTQVPLIEKEDYSCTDGFPHSNVGKHLLTVRSSDVCPTSMAAVAKFDVVMQKGHLKVFLYPQGAILILSYILSNNYILLLNMHYFHRKQLKDSLQKGHSYIIKKVFFAGI
ncbi:unnamed protein product, partial [Meganyctiphanes norvegica]